MLCALPTFVNDFLEPTAIGEVTIFGDYWVYDLLKKRISSLGPKPKIQRSKGPWKINPLFSYCSVCVFLPAAGGEVPEIARLCTSDRHMMLTMCQH